MGPNADNVPGVKYLMNKVRLARIGRQSILLQRQDYIRVIHVCFEVKPQNINGWLYLNQPELPTLRTHTAFVLLIYILWFKSYLIMY